VQARTDPCPDPPNHPKLDFVQICVAMIIISIAVHVAFQRLPQLAGPAGVWLIQTLAAWCDAYGTTLNIAGGNETLSRNASPSVSPLTT